MSITSNGSRPPTSDRVRRPSTTDQPFDPEELEAALQKTSLDPTKEVDTPLDGSGETSPSHQVENPMAAHAAPEPYDPEPPLRPRERLIAWDDDERVVGRDVRRVDTF